MLKEGLRKNTEIDVLLKRLAYFCAMHNSVTAERPFLGRRHWSFDRGDALLTCRSESNLRGNER